VVRERFGSTNDEAPVMRADQLSTGDVIDWRGLPATVQSVTIGRTVDVVIQWHEAGADHVCRITYPLMTAEEINAEWTDADFAARLEADLVAHPIALME